jgi:hypothetical protein
MSDFAIHFHDIRHGWAKCRVDAGSQSDETLVGYCSDAFGDIATLGLMAALERDFRILFDNEGSSPIWELSIDWDRLAERDLIPRFTVWDAGHYAHEVARDFSQGGGWRASAQKYLSFPVGYADVAGAISGAFDRLEADMGIKRFEEAWGEPWPTAPLVALRAALAGPKLL